MNYVTAFVLIVVTIYFLVLIYNNLRRKKSSDSVLWSEVASKHGEFLVIQNLPCDVAGNIIKGHKLGGGCPCNPSVEYLEGKVVRINHYFD